MDSQRKRRKGVALLASLSIHISAHPQPRLECQTLQLLDNPSHDDDNRKWALCRRFSSTAAPSCCRVGGRSE
ncbi:hypothetical protein N657DRAFT_647533 [Parathielavia appendiculata]|uniref:Uncharacterized protein n=1 Tax=Parathielavia appendiculata TaxID=2587402 RepID=A0AAN6Z1E7_9PEZI|nr:hypothetical protein N657DRAFT_647533 [Parathielavia appendiculata]